MDPWQLAGFVIGLVIAFTVLVVVRGFVLRAAIGVYTWHAGMTANIPMPSIGRAIEICVVSVAANLIAGFELGLNIGFLFPRVGVSGPTALATAQIASVPLAIAVSGVVFSYMLPTRFSKGCHVAICELLLIAVIVAVAFGIWYVASAAFSR